MTPPMQSNPQRPVLHPIRILIVSISRSPLLHNEVSVARGNHQFLPVLGVRPHLREEQWLLHLELSATSIRLPV